MNNTENSLTIKLPVLSNVSIVQDKTAEIDSLGYKFIVQVVDSFLNIHTQEVDEGDAAVFEGLPLGQVNIVIDAYDSNKTKCYSGNTIVILKEGTNPVTVTLYAVENNQPGDQINPENPDSQNNPGGQEDNEGKIITLIINESKKTELKTKDTLSAASFTVDEEYYPDSRTFAYWYDEKNNVKYKLTDEDSVKDFINSLKDNITLTAKYGVYKTDLVTYVTEKFNEKSDPEIIVLDGIYTDTITNDHKIPSFSSYSNALKNNTYARGITLDYTECLSCTGLDSNAYTNTSTRWIDVLKLPSSVTTISSIYAVLKDVYIQLPEEGKIQFISGTTDSNAKYTLHFAGTLEDWCSKVEIASQAYDLIKNLNEFYVLDENGNEICIKGEKASGELEIKNTITEIGDYSFRYFPCSTIKLPDTITAIGDTAFGESSATEVYFGNSVTKIETGALYYAYSDSQGAARRAVYYKGSLDDWMKITCYAKTGAREGGPLNGASDLLIKKSGDTAYTSVLDENGGLVITVPEGVTELNGQLQGFRGIKKLKFINNSSYSIKKYAFYNCSNLEEIVFDGTGTYNFSDGSTIFNGLSPKTDDAGATIPVKVYVPSSLLSTCTGWGVTGVSFIDIAE